MDTLRNCYASWMAVPEFASPIRVRWYPVERPAAGTYELTDYASSNWDEDPKSLDPALGEQSTTRDPFKDYRECCPPPWAFPDGDDCPVAAAPVWSSYIVPAVTISDGAGHTATVPQTTLPQTAPCTWDSGHFPVAGFDFHWQLRVNSDGSMTLVAFWSVHPPFILLGFWDSGGVVDPYGPLALSFRTAPPTEVTGPEFIRVTGIGRDAWGVDTCTGVVDDAEDWIEL